jgi:hypothetical protein
MLDIETLGTEERTKVLSIGAVRFRLEVVDDIRSIKKEGRGFYSRLDEEDQALLGRTEDADTVAWWKDQGKAAQKVFKEKREPVKEALDRFIEFCSGVKRIWGNGNMFDNAIVRSLCDDYDVIYPVNYWRDLDVRTLTYLWNLLTSWRSKGKRPDVNMGVLHNALDDARRQTIQGQLMIKELKGTKYGS